VFYSSNGGDSWVSRNEGLPNNDGSGSGIVATADGNVYVAPTGSPVYRKAGVTSVVEDVPVTLRMASVYPNPSRDRAFITLDLDHNQRVEISLHAADGSVVEASQSLWLERGTHTLERSTHGLAAGRYLWVVRSNGVVSTGMVTVVH
jgi:hypothetical protein